MGDPDGRIIEVAQITDSGLQYFLDFDPESNTNIDAAS